MKYEKFRYSILMFYQHVFCTKNITVITVEPNKNSLGLELGTRKEVHVGTSEANVNDISNCEIDILENICQSEDFKRGFLVVALVKDPLDRLLNEFVKFQQGMRNAITELKSTLAFCDYDYNYFYLFNSKLGVAELRSLEPPTLA